MAHENVGFTATLVFVVTEPFLDFTPAMKYPSQNVEEVETNTR